MPLSNKARSRALTAPICAALLLAAAILAGCGGGSPSSSTGSTAAKSTSSTAITTASSTTGSSTAAPSASAETHPGVVTASSGGVTATLHAGTHHPRVEAPWPISFTVTRGGAPAHAGVSYEYLFAGQVVARRSHYTFTGRFADVFRWPASAVGYPLTFRAAIVSGTAHIDLDYPVQVAR